MKNDVLFQAKLRGVLAFISLFMCNIHGHKRQHSFWGQNEKKKKILNIKFF